MVYDRKVRYLDYSRNGERIKGCGFARTEVYGENFKLELTLKGIPAANGLNSDVILSTAEREAVLGRVRIENGGGVFRYQGNLKRDIPGREMDCEELSGLRIPLGEGIQASCSWQPVRERKENPVEESVSGGGAKKRRREEHAREEAKTAEKKEREERESRQSRKGSSERTENPKERESYWSRNDLSENTGNQKEQEVRQSREDLSENARIQREREVRQSRNDLSESAGTQKEQEARQNREDLSENGGNPRERKSYQSKEGLSERAENQREREEHQNREIHRSREDLSEQAAEQTDREEHRQEDSRPVRLHEDKWLQLSAIYPHIQPFRDERDYLSVGPADFVLFSAESYRAVNNSFLLHGYYNYRHLILTRMERRGEILYYVGVPGNYFDREKQVAVMFGFESFECAEEPAQDGDFGYYMMKVEI